LFAPHTYIFVLRAHPVHGESYNQRNTTGEVATAVQLLMKEFEECGKILKSYQQRQDIASRIYRVSHQFYFVHKINPKQS